MKFPLPRRNWIFLLIASLLALVWLAFSHRSTKEARIEKEWIEAELSSVVSEQVPITREVTGTIISANDATLASRIQALVNEIRVKEGSRVKAGEILILLDDRDLRAQRDQAEAELENAKLQLQRVKSLYAERSAAKQELDNAERIHKVSDAALRSIDAKLADTTIRAPFDGIITSKWIEVGELAAPGRPLLRIENPLQFQLEVTVAESDVSQLRVGQSVGVKLDAMGDTDFTARLSQILPAADPSTHSFIVKTDLAMMRGVRSGLFGRMIFPVGTRSSLLVPQSAVSTRGELSQVYVVGDSGFLQIRLVQVGKVHGDKVEVLSGLSAGEHVLTQFFDGQEGKFVRIPAGPPS